MENDHIDLGLTMNQTKASSLPTAVQTAVVIALAIAVSTLLYSHWYQECCMDTSRGLVAILTLPAMFIGLVLAGGNVHGGSEWMSYVGLAVEFYLLLWLVRWFKFRWTKP